MTGETDSEYLRLYREALANHEEHIVEVLKVGVWDILLTRLKPRALTDEELRGIKHVQKQKSDQAREIIKLVREKDNIEAYIGFSRALCDNIHFKKNEVFPFVSELERLGRHPPVQRNTGRQAIQSVHNIEKADILWVIQSKQDFDKLASLDGHVLQNDQSIHDFWLKTVSIPVELSAITKERFKATLNLACPRNPRPDYNTFFSAFEPRPRIILLTTQGIPLGSSCHGDVVVVLRGEPTAICAEVEHVTALWRLNRTIQGKIVFGRGTSRTAHEDPDFLVSSEDMIRFYTAADKLKQEVASLAITGLTDISSSNAYHFDYCYKLVHYLLRKFL